MLSFPQPKQMIEQFAETVTEKIAELSRNKDLYHFWVDGKTNTACFGLTINEEWSEKYSYLEDLSPELFTSMVKVLLEFEQQHRVGATENPMKLSILTYHFKWKSGHSFHLKLHPNSIEKFRSLILHYTSNEQVAKTFMSREIGNTKFKDFESEYQFTITNHDDTDVFHVEDHVTDAGLRCKFFISRRTYCLVAMNTIGISECEDPYNVAYHHARTLEKRFGKDVVGGVNFAFDHIKRQILVWAKCVEDQFEAKVLEQHVPLITKTGAFQQYNKLPPPPIREGCKCVFLTFLSDNTCESELEMFFRDCGRIVQITMPRHPDGKGKGFAFVEFENATAVEKAIQLHNTPLRSSDRSRKVHVQISWN